MSFASTALRHRERESKALRIFLACSLAGSLIFHLALLASGIGKYLLNRVPEVEDEPVEITLLDTPIEEIEPKEEVKPQQKPEPKKIEPKLEKLEPLPEPKAEIKQPDLDTTPSESRISGGSPFSSLSQPIPTQRRITPQAPPVIKPLPKPDFKAFKQFEEPLSPVLPSAPTVAVREKPVISEQKPEPKPEPKPIAKNDISEPIPQPEPEIRTPREFSTPVTPPVEQPAPKPDEDLKKLLAQERDSIRTARDFSTPVTPPIEPPAPAPEADEDLKNLLAQQRDSIRTAREFSTPVTPPIEPPVTTQQDNGELRDTLSGIRQSRDTNISRNNTTPLPDTSNTGESNNNAPRRKREIIGGNNVASAPTNTTDTGTGNGLGNGSGDSVGDGDGRAACRRCDRSYPSWAKSKGIEGNITVSVNSDAQGNITDVQLLSGSGNERLDDYHVEMAGKWKLKPSSNGRTGVTIITKYELQ